jgi:hypothetical protein
MPEMSQQTREILEEFVQKSHKLKAFNFHEHVRTVRLGFNIYRMEDGENPTIEFTQSDVKERDASLLTLRMFIQHNEPISFHGLKRLLVSSELSEEWRDKAGKLIASYFEYCDQYPPYIQDQWGKRPTNGQILDTVLYGGLVHTGLDTRDEKNEKKRKRFRDWTENDLKKNMLLQAFDLAVLNVIRLIYRIAEVTETELAAQNGKQG